MRGSAVKVIAHADNRFELVPMKAVPENRSRPAESQPVQATDGWLPPGGYQASTQWALDNRRALEAYAGQISEVGTAAEQLQQFLASQNDAAPR